jgi:hypothetical protein
MSCIKLQKVPKPDLSLLLPSLNLVIPDQHIGLSLCCELSLPIHIPIPPIHLLGGPVVVAALVAANQTISEAIDQLNDLLDQVQVDCPLEGPIGSP